MLIEMHSHTAEHSSCSHVAAVDLVRRAFELGLQGIVLTDHHRLWSPDELAWLRRESEVPKYFLLLSGQEVTTFDVGDVLVYGPEVTIRKGTPLRIIRERFPEAALVWAHPYRDEKIPSGEQLLHPWLDGIEIFNSNQTFLENSRGLRDWHRLRFTAVGGTDTHALSYTGTFPTQFDHPVNSMEELASELKMGRCRPFFKEIPRAGSNIQITELTLGARGERNGREKIIVKELNDFGKWDAAERAHRILAGLVAHGFEKGPFRIPHPLDRDDSHLTLIEEGIRGRSLFDSINSAPPAQARHYLELTAGWLARLHNFGLCVTPRGEYGEKEPGMLSTFLEAFTAIGHGHSRRVREILDILLEMESRILEKPSCRMVQGHGDFNPKNILLGRVNPDDPDSLFVAAVDFDHSFCQPPAFDVGTFLAQFRNQFFHRPEVLEKLPEELFLESYLNSAEGVEEDFPAQVELYRVRANMEIAYYLVKVGLGESENLWRILVESDQILARLEIKG